MSVARLRGLALICVLVIALDWGAKAAASRWLSDVITNPHPPALWTMALIAVLALALCATLARPAAVLGCGLAAGGALSNTLDSLRGQVRDFIPLPVLRGGWECNLADLAILTGSVLCAALVARLLLTHLQAERALRTAPVAA